MRSAKFLTGMLCMVLLPAVLHAQNITISGYVTEKKSGERLTGATVYVPKKNIGTSTNTYGFYSLTFPADSVELRASFLGFQPFVANLKADKDIRMDIELDQTKDLKEVVVVAQKDALQTRTQMSTIDLPISTIKSLPAFLGEVDIMKAIQLLPGVQAGGEGSSGLYVRGGSPDQNLILLDGVPVYNASHLFGFFSVFNADAIRSVEVIKGGFPAHYGGRLSSVIDINMKEGNKNKLHGEGGVGIIASRLTLEGPIQKGKSSFMISGRRTYVDVLAAPFMRGSIKAGYYFYDLNGKINFKLGNKDHVYFSGYLGDDKFYASENNTDNPGGGNINFNSQLKWGNITSVGRWNHEFNKKLFGNLTTYYSQYKFLISARERSTVLGSKEEFAMSYSSGINDKAVKYDFDFVPGSNHLIKAGVGFINHIYKPGIQTSKIKSSFVTYDTTIGAKDINANEMDIYVEDDIRLTSRFKTNIGVHATGFTVGGEFFKSIQPRVAARYLINDELSAKASYVQMSQFIHLLTNASIGLPTDLWVPATKKVPVQQSQQYAAGLAYTHKTGVEVSLEGYYKTMNNVIEYKEGSSYFGNGTSWEDKISIGSGRSYGGELFLQKKKGQFTGMLGYTLSWTNRKFADLNKGERFPYKYDRRHDFKVAGVYKVSDRIELSAEWVYGTGQAVTIPTAVIPGLDGGMIQLYGPRNGYRAPAYHRADVSAKFTKVHKNWESAWVISIYNLYDRRNAFYIYSTTGEAGNTIFKQVSLFPVLPSISYQFKF